MAILQHSRTLIGIGPRCELGLSQSVAICGVGPQLAESFAVSFVLRRGDPPQAAQFGHALWCVVKARVRRVCQWFKVVNAVVSWVCVAVVDVEPSNVDHGVMEYLSVLSDVVSAGVFYLHVAAVSELSTALPSWVQRTRTSANLMPKAEAHGATGDSSSVLVRRFADWCVLAAAAFAQSMVRHTANYSRTAYGGAA